VVLDVVYNHTCEGDYKGPIYSFKGLDSAGYYMLSSDPANPYANYSGTGNTLNFGQAQVRKMVIDSLRYWKRGMHVDGFRFDLASVFSRNADGSLNWGEAPIFSEIAADPELGRVRLIAEPWDTAAYQLGRGFPGQTWLQWNGRFRDDVRRFVKGDTGMVPEVMRRIYGSDDLFPDSRADAYHAYQSVNYVTSHDGFTLYDLVSYDGKHNWQNGNNNQDGTDANYSWNCGQEGDEGVSAAVRALRRQQVKNFCCLLFLSNGTPMFRAGDEFLNTQLGNNNPYNQDNEIGWLDWSQLQSNGHSERNACITSTRAARAAGSTDAITATAISTNAETNTGNAPGILTSRKYLPAKRASTNPNAAPARTPAAAITVPSAITPLRSCCGSDPRASRMPNSRVRALTENASTPATPTTAIANATAANTPNTSEFKRSGVSTSARMSSRVAARSTG
jgi:glycogen debranching enzyme GlgX